LVTGKFCHLIRKTDILRRHFGWQLMAHFSRSLTRRITTVIRGRAAIGCWFGCYALRSSRSGCLAFLAVVDPKQTFGHTAPSDYDRQRLRTLSQWAINAPTMEVDQSVVMGHDSKDTTA
jgi:hypothetical protein